MANNSTKSKQRRGKPATRSHGRGVMAIFGKVRHNFGRLAKPMQRMVVALAIIGFGFVGFNVLVATAPSKPLQPRQEQIWTVEAANVVFRDAFPRRSSFGQVEATRKADLSFTISGEVALVADVFRNGEVVEEGEILARLDEELLLIARDEIAIQRNANAVAVSELATQLRLRRQQFNRTERMNQAAVVPQATLDEASLALSIATNALEQARLQQNQLELQLRRAEKNLADAVLRAPFDGVLANVNIGSGQVVSPAMRLGRITDIASLEVAFVVPSDVFVVAAAMIGTEVEVVWQSGGRAITTSSGRIRHAEGNVDSSDGGGRLYAVLPMVAGSRPPIPEGAFVEVRYTSGRVNQVAELPEAALYGEDTVFVILNNRTQARRVDVVQKSPGLVYVRGNINEGDRVVATRLPVLGNGTLVQVRDETSGYVRGQTPAPDQKTDQGGS